MPVITPFTRKTSASGHRTYEIDGVVMPSVTTVLSCIGKPFLVPWAAKMERELVMESAANLYEETSSTAKWSRATYLATLLSRMGKQKAFQKEGDKAKEIGSQVHALIEWNLRKNIGETVGSAPIIHAQEGLWAMMVWEDFSKAHDLRPSSIEQTVWSTQHRYAGTMDWVAELDGVQTVGDWKTGKAIYPEYLMQISAYMMALVEMGHAKKGVQGCLVRFPKLTTDPAAEMRIVLWEEAEQHFEVFLHVMQLFHWVQAQESVRKKA